MNNRKNYLTGMLIVATILLKAVSANAGALRTSVGLKADSTFPPFPERPLRYHPEGQDFVIVNGTKRYNRALYGTHTAFRVEGGDLPEFALYMPGIGGDMKLGVVTEKGTKWFNDFDTVEARYRPGSMIYRLKDRIIGQAQIHLQLLAMSDREGMILKAAISGNQQPMQLIAVYGGASGINPSRNGDLGADPESVFYLTPEHSKGDHYQIDKNHFSLTFDSKRQPINLEGTMPADADLKIGDAHELASPEKALQAPASSEMPLLVCKKNLNNHQPLYFVIQRKDSASAPSYNQLPELFAKAEQYREQLAGRVQIHTPDPFLNTLGGDISVAGDAIWESPAYLHGAVAWRMWLPGWRGPYVANDLGWHNRAETEFSAYNQMQLTQPDTVIPFPDPKKNLARQKEKIGVGIFNSGYITRYPKGKLQPNHYDMNLVYFDEMLRNFQWTGDTAFLRKCWPAIKRDIAWEKRNFDEDDNGLFDAYACIWASDALQYSGGDVTHSSAYNYFANEMAARIAKILGDNPVPYEKEAEKIMQAMDSILWMPEKGWYAEYKDRLGLKLLHPDAGLWTIYHSIDSQVPDAFQAYQSLRYIDTHIPHIPIKCDELKGKYNMLSTTDWMPYTWSVNNVVMAEIAHTALAYWEGGRKNTAFNIFKSMILESMYLGSSPGNFEQISYYDRARGELYRDFADPIGISSRALVEGLFGIRPDALADTLTIKPGFPDQWPYASIHLPDIDYHFKRKAKVDDYTIKPSFEKKMILQMELTAKANVQNISINGKAVNWQYQKDAIGQAIIIIQSPYADQYHISVSWGNDQLAAVKYDSMAIAGENFRINSGEAKIKTLKDPQKTLTDVAIHNNQLNGKVIGNNGWHTFFVQLQQGKLQWWAPVNFQIKPAYQIAAADHQNAYNISFRIVNNTKKTFSENALIAANNYNERVKLNIAAGDSSTRITIPAKALMPGANKVSVRFQNNTIDTVITNWNISSTAAPQQYDRINLSAYYNALIPDIFNNQYLKPRPDVPTLQLPEQGIGNWCYPTVKPEIDDSGLRQLSADSGYFKLPDGVTFETPAKAGAADIIYTSQWKNYPDQVTVPLKGKAAHAYLLMAGSTDPMQSRLVNGKVIVHYADGSADSLLLKNPDNWWPIEQDYVFDQHAFHTDVPLPYRLHLKTGLITRHFSHYQSIKGFSDFGIPGGAATVLDMPLNKNKTLASIEVRAVANDVVIGLSALTLAREVKSKE